MGLRITIAAQGPQTHIAEKREADRRRLPNNISTTPRRSPGGVASGLATRPVIARTSPSSVMMDT